MMGAYFIAHATGDDPVAVRKELEAELRKREQGHRGSYIVATVSDEHRTWLREMASDLNKLADMEDGTAVALYIGEVEIELNVTVTEECVSVMRLNEDGNRSNGCAEMSRMDDGWFLNRCFVREEERGQGLGRAMIEKLKERSRGLRIVVTPGGYTDDFEGQVDFYESCGFVYNEKENHWEWRKCQ